MARSTSEPLVWRPERLGHIQWPDQKRFAFTVFDDPDSQTVRDGRLVYDFLADQGFRITKGVWPTRGPRKPSDHGETCAESAYLRWAQQLQERGFEIAWHGATLHTSYREETRAGLERFEQFFGHPPATMAQHYYCQENVYWGDGRVSGLHRALYNVLTRGQNRNHFFGHVPGHPYYWSDLCRSRIRYVRNFAFGEINTLKVCPAMPYHDPERPDVKAWFASSEGANVRSFTDRISEENQDRLEEEGGACIMYAHFAHGFVENGSLSGRFRSLMERLARKGGWFVPVATLLDYLLEQRGAVTIDDGVRRALERKWLIHKIRFGTA